MIARRGFLHAILAAGMAPAVVKASSLMRIVVPSTTILRPGDAGYTDTFCELEHSMPLFKGEIGHYEKIRFIESPYMPAKINAWRSGYLAKRFDVGRWG